jgi:hypothetical protein
LLVGEPEAVLLSARLLGILGGSSEGDAIQRDSENNPRKHFVLVGKDRAECLCESIARLREVSSY